MSVPPLNPVAWKAGAAYTKYHLEYSEAMGRTLCGQVVPQFSKVQRYRTSDEETCKACLAKLDQVTAQRLKVTR